MKRFRRHSAKANFEHFRVLTARYFKQIFTNIGTFLPLLLEAPVLLVILYLVADGDAFTARNVGQANIATFVLVVMATLMAILNSYREICKEREVLAREIYGGLDVTAYVLSKIVVLSAIGLVQCALLFGGSLIFIDYAFPHPATGYLLAYLSMALANIAVTALGLFISALLKKSESAILPVLLVIIMQVVFRTASFPWKAARAISNTSRRRLGAFPFSGTFAASTGGTKGFIKRCTHCPPRSG